MTVLCDTSIEMMCSPRFVDKPAIDPFNKEQLQPASYDLRLGLIRLNGKNYEEMEIRPREFLLASTLEKIYVPPHLAARIEGKSSVARSGITIESAGFIDPGFEGELTLELVNNEGKNFPLRRGMLIAQIRFEMLDRKAARPYGSEGLGSHYQGQTGPTPAAK